MGEKIKSQKSFIQISLRAVFLASMIILFVPAFVQAAPSISQRLKGKILLQVESVGKAWYVNPVNLKRYYLGRPDDAFKIMRELSLGISNKDFDRFKNVAPPRLSGRILLKVEDSGKAYYVYPDTLKMYFLGRPSDAFNIMKDLSLGITNNNLEKIEAVVEKTKLEPEATKNKTKIDEGLSQLISQAKQNADIFSQAKNEANNFISTARDTMNKYPDSSLMQQSGQQLINECNNLSFISGKLFDIENDRIKINSSFLGSGNFPSVNDFSTSIAQYKDYRNQYDLVNIKIKSLMETFVANEKTVLEEKLGEKRDEKLRLEKATQAIKQLVPITQEINNQLTILDSQIKEKEAEIEDVKNAAITKSTAEARLAILIPELNSLIDQWNFLLDKRQKIITLTYKIDDYANYGILLSAEDRTFLLSLGISF